MSLHKIPQAHIFAFFERIRKAEISLFVDAIAALPGALATPAALAPGDTPASDLNADTGRRSFAAPPARVGPRSLSPGARVSATLRSFGQQVLDASPPEGGSVASPACLRRDLTPHKLRSRGGSKYFHDMR